MSDRPDAGGTIAWMAKTPVAANLLMILFLLGGFLMATRIKQEVFPDFERDEVLVTIPYPGASPEEVEQGIIFAVEEAVRGLDGVKEVSATANEGAASVVVELLLGADNNKVLQDVKNEIDRITSFPEDAEEPQVRLATMQREVISLVLYGEMGDRVLRDLAEKVRDDLLALPSITLVELAGIRPRQIEVSIRQETLRRYGLTLEEVAATIRREALELPGGTVKTEAGEVLLRLRERRDYASQFRSIPLLSRPDGSEVRLGEVATLRDTFAETDVSAYFDNKPAVMVKVFRVGDQTPIEVSEDVHAYVEELRAELPEGVGVATWFDRAEIYGERVDLLLRNAGIGLVLVLVLLGLFLEARLAFWVTMGIPVSFLGAILFLPLQDVTINMISLFAFIMALGMVVDDAIVVGENIYHARQDGKPFLKAAIHGAREVAIPVVFSITTNVAAFMPMYFVTGISGKIFRMIPAVVISVFLVSLAEALWILPAHLGHAKPTPKSGPRARLRAVQLKIGQGLERFIAAVYRPFVEAALRWRYVTAAVALAVLLITLALVQSGRVGIAPFPQVESDVVFAAVELPFGSPVEETRRIQARMAEKAREVLARHGGEDITRGIFMQVGAGMPRRGSAIGRGGHVANVQIFLVPMDQRSVGSRRIVNEWREAVGRIPGVETMNFRADIGGPSGGSPVNVELSHPRMDVLEAASADLAARLLDYAGTGDIDDGFQPGKPQFDFRITPAGQSLGLSAAAIGRQLRNAYYGAEALRQQRGRDEVKVMVRFPEEDRRSLESVEEFILRAPGGGEIPLREAAWIERGRSYTSIKRVEGRRVVNVTADVQPREESTRILENLRRTELPELMKKYDGLEYSLEGERREFLESMESLGVGFVLALVVIYAMLAIPFGSYIQPLIIMASIPFGIVGAVLGHMLMGYSLSILSMMGIVALAGVVVNDSLVLIDFANRRRLAGDTAFVAVAGAGQRRFRPILLTSLTTFGGLAPMIFETSMQARFLIPMAISLGYGILFATLIALVLVPTLYLIIEDIRSLVGIEAPESSLVDVDEEGNA